MNTTMAELKKVAIIATSYGVEEAEIVEPKKYVESIGNAVTVATPDNETIQTLEGDKDPASKVSSDVALSSIHAADFDLLVIPGGTLNADSLRIDTEAQRIIKEFADAGKPVAAICHGPWLAVETGLAQGKTLTSYASLHTDIANAGGNWVDKSVVVDDASGYTLITSRTPADLDDFNAAIGAQLA